MSHTEVYLGLYSLHLSVFVSAKQPPQADLCAHQRDVCQCSREVGRVRLGPSCWTEAVVLCFCGNPAYSSVRFFS